MSERSVEWWRLRWKAGGVVALRSRWTTGSGRVLIAGLACHEASLDLAARTQLIRDARAGVPVRSPRLLSGRRPVRASQCRLVGALSLLAVRVRRTVPRRDLERRA
ncbi:hypothetical protein MXD59_05035 [Frankia sp. Ag45/Mut15]|uniref:Uncharacterized protein n=1 Tax=Frankia umida TaxID=573489 RepID=A0ABT0JUC3_9ACTN|nr:hypothetical protein [Frankia umida]MCK9875152.1 hypothetical protein [Frankia umida]